MKYVAVVGVGDSGRTAVEALTGQGPSMGMSTASLDRVEQIDWYGLAEVATTREAREGCNRSRYRGLGRLLPRAQAAASGQVGEGRLLPRGRAGAIAGGYECAYVDERPYDHVILCTGFASRDDVPLTEYLGLEYPDGWVEDFVNVDGRAIARKFRREEVYIVGPAAEVPLGDMERNTLGPDVPENSTALFRYAARTAALAAPRESNEDVRLPLVVVNDVEFFLGDEVRGRTKRGKIIGLTQTGDSVVVDSPGTTRTREGVVGAGIRLSNLKLVKRGLSGAPLGKDSKGRDLFVGDRVTMSGSLYGTLFGFVPDQPPIIGAVVETPGQENGGGYYIGEQRVFGLTPDGFTLLARAEQTQLDAQDARGYPLFLGNLYDCAGFTGELLGKDDTDCWLLDCRVPGGSGNGSNKSQSPSTPNRSGARITYTSTELVPVQ